MTNTPDDDVDQDSGPSTKAPDDARPDLPGASGDTESSGSGSVGGDTGTGDSGSTSQ
jgi:hypothetical protein